VRLERDGLVVRRQHATDGRARSVALTAKGRRLQKKLAEFNAPFQAELEGLFQPEEVKALLAYLDRISQAMLSSRARTPPNRSRST
jgi:DNA-binding MarR family transcriptional regulator